MHYVRSPTNSGGLIGTGSSGVHSIPVIAEQAADLTVFQRTPAYSLPARNRRLRDDEIREMKENYRAYRKAQRESGFGVPARRPPRPARPAGAGTSPASRSPRPGRATMASIIYR